MKANGGVAIMKDAICRETGEHTMTKTQIEWTDATWNPVAGCSVTTAGCTHCYAMEMARRLEATGVKQYACKAP